MSASIDHQRVHSSESSEWRTPARYIEAVRAVLGSIDLDPASCEDANETIQAVRIFTAADDGLAPPWYGAVFLNPPYGKREGISNQALWSHKVIAEYEVGRVAEAILLVNAQTPEQWFQPLWRFTICFTDHRIRFDCQDGRRAASPTHGNAFIYFGPRPTHFAEVFRQFGRIVWPEAGQ